MSEDLVERLQNWKHGVPKTMIVSEAIDEIESLRSQIASARKAGMIAAMHIVGEMRMSEARIFDEKYSGQRGEDRSNALYDAYQAIRIVAEMEGDPK